MPLEPYEQEFLVSRFPVAAWLDLEGPISVPATGANKPILTQYDGEIEDYAFAALDHYGPIKYHLPHMMALNENFFIHTHWSHNGTNISGNLSLEYRFTYAKGHNQQAFHSEKVLPHLISGLTLANTPAKQHRIDEIVCSTPGGSSTLLNTSDLEPDGLILLHFNVLAIPTITGGAAKPFIHYVDIHYKADRFGTISKSPNFNSSHD